MKKVFPLSFFGKNLKSVIVSTLIYTFIIILLKVLLSCFTIGGAFGIIVNVIFQFIRLYCVSGIVIAVLNACSLLDKKWFE